jgi:CHASE2 domain-containing sensor protein
VPVWPRRRRSLAGVLFAALIVGAWLAFALDRQKPLVRASGAPEELSGIPVLAVVGSAFPERARRTRRRELWNAALVTACLIVACGVALMLSHNGVRITVPSFQRLV